MPLVVKDRVQETTTTTGTGSLTLAGAVSGFQTFSSAVGNGNTTYYAIDGGSEWEVGIGTVGSGTLSRDTILESSNAGSAVNFSAGVKNVFVTYPAEKSVDTDTAQTISNKTIEGSSIGATTASTGRFTSVTTPSVTATTNDLTLSAISTGAVNLNTLGGTQFKAIDATSSVNVWNVRGGDGFTTSPRFTTEGTGTNIAGQFNTKGTGALQFFTGNTEQMRITNTASAVNFVQVSGGATGQSSLALRPRIQVQGSDASVGLTIDTKGSGSVDFTTNSNNLTSFRVFLQDSPVNYLQVRGASTNIEPVLSAQGSDTNISMALQSKGTGAIDLAAGSQGVNISNGGTVTAITRTGNGTGYTTFPSVTISAPTTAGGVQATASLNNMQSIGASISAGGTGYTLNDVITISGGTPVTVAATFTVTGVSGGVVTAVTALNFAPYTVLPTAPVSTTGGTGTGLTLTNLTWAIGSSFTITNAGSGYTSQPTVTFSGGGGSGAAAYATVGGNTTVRGIGTTTGASITFSTPAGDAVKIADAGASTTNFIYMGTGATPFITSQGTNAPLALSSNGTGTLWLRTNGAGTNQLAVTHTASAVNYVQVTGNATTGAPTISAQGSDTNVGLQIATKGTGSLLLQPAGVNTLRLDSASGRVNQFQMYTIGTGTGGASGNIVMLGTDTNIDLSLTTKGTGALNVIANGATQFRVGETAITNAVNYVSVFGGATGVAPRLLVRGTDTNINLLYSTKGSGEHVFRTNDTNTDQFRITHTASAVNYVQVTGSATGSAARISTQGSDGTVGFGISAKGGAQIFFQNNGSSNTSLVLNGGTSTVNYLQINATNTTLAPSVQAQGTDTNIDLTLTPKGTGKVVLTNGLQGGTF
jgi:hypothetical protein